MTKKREDITKDLLIELYCNTDNSTRDVAKELNCGQSTIRSKLKLYNILSKDRNNKYWKEVRINKLIKSIEKYSIEPELLLSLYWGNEYSTTQIAKCFGCTSANIIRKMRKYEIPRRSVIEFSEYRKLDIPENEIIALYNEGKSSLKIGKMYDCTNNTIIKILKKHNVEIKKRNFYPTWCTNTKGLLKPNKTSFKKGLIPWNKGITGEMSHSWKGGKSKRGYSSDFTERLKEEIRGRDNYTCQECGKLQTDRALDVHHINYDKKDVNKDNLIALCQDCHRKTNYKRNDWISYFRNKMGDK